MGKIIFDVEAAKPAEAAVRTAAALKDAAAWFFHVQRRNGLLSTQIFGNQKWPSARLDFRLAARFFAVNQQGSHINLIAFGDDHDAKTIWHDRLAWFALVPWVVEVKRTNAGSFLQLTAPAFDLGEFSSSEFILQIPFHYQMTDAVSRIERFVFQASNGDQILGWTADYA